MIANIVGKIPRQIGHYSPIHTKLADDLIVIIAAFLFRDNNSLTLKSPTISALCALLGSSYGFQSSAFPRRSKSVALSMIIPVKGGSIVALVTPMTVDNAIDYGKLESLLRWHMAEGQFLQCELMHLNELISIISDCRN
jgi:hypothetical protein